MMTRVFLLFLVFNIECMTKSFDIAFGRETIHAGILPAELRRTFIANLERSVGDIRVTLVSPGVTESELADTISDEEARDLMKEYRRISIPASAIAQSILYAISQPAEVDVNEIVVRPTASMA